jgi:hypothetical protein
MVRLMYSTFRTTTVALRVFARVVPMVLEVLDEQSEVVDPDDIAEIVLARVRETSGPQVGVLTARTLSLICAGVVSLTMDLRENT